MANEITLSIAFKASNGNYVPGTISLSNVQFDQASAGAQEGVQNVGTTHEVLDTTLVTTPGWLYIRNMDATNFVGIGVDVSATFYETARIEAGEPALFRVGPSTTLYLKADTAACDVFYRLLED